MPKNTTSTQSTNEQIMTLNFLVMKHICEILVPVYLPDPNISRQTLSEVFGNDQVLQTLREGLDNDQLLDEDEERFVRNFIRAIGLEMYEVDDELLSLAPLPNPTISDVVIGLRTWWQDYSIKCKDQSIVYSPMDAIFACYGEKAQGTHSASDISYEYFDKLISVICGETFTSVWNKVTKNPFIDYVAPGKRPNAYSIDVMLFKKATYCDVSDTDVPAENFYLQMQLVTANPSVIGKNLSRLVGLTATSLVHGRFSSSHCVTDLIICKNGQRFIKLPISLKPMEMNGTKFHEDFDENNKEWQRGYELDFSRLEVIRSNEFLLKSISDALPEKDRYSFLGSHFSADLGI